MPAGLISAAACTRFIAGMGRARAPGPDTCVVGDAGARSSALDGDTASAPTPMPGCALTLACPGDSSAAASDAPECGLSSSGRAGTARHSTGSCLPAPAHTRQPSQRNNTISNTTGQRVSVELLCGVADCVENTGTITLLYKHTCSPCNPSGVQNDGNAPWSDATQCAMPILTWNRRETPFTIYDIRDESLDLGPQSRREGRMLTGHPSVMLEYLQVYSSKRIVGCARTPARACCEYLQV